MITPTISEGVAIECRDGVLRITFDRPARKNSLDPPSMRRKLSGAEAAAWGLIYRAVPDEELEATTAALVERIAGAATVAFGLTKQCIHRSLQSGLADALQNESFALELSSRTADFKEGLLAFKERRPARFTGQ